MHIHILPGNATYNRGDRINLTAQIAMLRERWPDCTLTVSSFLPARDAPWYDATCVRRTSAALTTEELRAIQSADVVLWGGGGVMADNACRLLLPHWWATLRRIKKHSDAPIMAWAHGVVLETRLGEWLAPRLYAYTNTITVRDRDSQSRLERLPHMPGPVQVTADPAWTLTPARTPRTSTLLASCGLADTARPLAIITPTFWPFYHRASDIVPYQIAAKMGWRQRRQEDAIEGFIRHLTHIADRLVQQQGMEVLLIPHYPDWPWRDLEHVRTIRSLCTERSHVHVLEDAGVAPRDIASVWACAKLGVCHGYHDTILALTARIPCLQLCYEPKGRALRDILSLQDSTLEWKEFCGSDGVDRAWGMINRILSASATAVQPRPEQLHAMRQCAQENLTALEQMLGSQASRA